MSKRPDHAADCPGCDTGWVTGELLCPLCASAVQTAQPAYYPSWLSARAALDLLKESTMAAASEAYKRGLIVGTARVCSAARALQRLQWKKNRRPA